MGLDLTKPVRTRDGRPVRILCTDANGPAPIFALVKTSDFRDDVHRYKADGKLNQIGISRGDDPLDLVNVPETTSVYAAVYPYRADPYAKLFEYDCLADAALEAGERGRVLEIVYEDGVPKQAVLW